MELGFFTCSLACSLVQEERPKAKMVWTPWVDGWMDGWIDGMDDEGGCSNF